MRPEYQLHTLFFRQSFPFLKLSNEFTKNISRFQGLIVIRIIINLLKSVLKSTVNHYDGIAECHALAQHSVVQYPVAARRPVDCM